MKLKKTPFQLKRLFAVIVVSLLTVSCPSPVDSPAEDPATGDPPAHMAGNLSFTDKDPTPGEIGGTVSIVRASHETDFTHYVLYWGSGPNTKISQIVQLEKTGSDLTYTISSHTSIPAGASYLLVYTKNEDTEMGTCVSLEFYDAQNNSGLITVEPISGWTPRTLISRHDTFNFDDISGTYRSHQTTMLITNNTTEGLHLEGNPVIAFTDPTPWFILNTNNTADYIAPGGTTTFTVQFVDTSTTAGAASDQRSAQIRIENLSLDNAEAISDYIFSISGTSKITRQHTYYSNTGNITFSGFITKMSIAVRGGGGGGGGGGKGDGSNILGCGGGGGGAGYLISETINSRTLTASVTIGSGGARGTGATQFNGKGTAGTDGGETVLIINGATYTAAGGKCGGGGGFLGSSLGGAGGAGNPNGQAGYSTGSYAGGAGGNSGSDHGSGGRGGNGSTTISTSGGNGQAGTSGYVTIQYTGYEIP